MKLSNIDVAEIKVTAVYMLSCFMCSKELHVNSEIGSTGDVAMYAATKGWHSYETADEHCSIACPSCIQEVKENEKEAA